MFAKELDDGLDFSLIRDTFQVCLVLIHTVQTSLIYWLLLYPITICSFVHCGNHPIFLLEYDIFLVFIIDLSLIRDLMFFLEQSEDQTETLCSAMY